MTNSLEVIYLTEADQQEWNNFVAQTPSFALLQSYEWGEFKKRLGWQVYRLAVEKQGQIVAGAQMLIKKMPLGIASVAYIPRGPVGDWLDEAIAPRLLVELHQVARRHRAIFLKIEPPLPITPVICQLLQQHHFKVSPYTNQPSTTIIVDLKPSLDDILKQMRKKTRQYIRQAITNGVTVCIGSQEDLPTFYNLMQITGRRAKFSPHHRLYYEYLWQIFTPKNQTVLLMAFHEDQLLAARTVYCFGNHAAEFSAGSLDSLDDHKGLNPNHLLVWEAIKWAKMQGCHTYDLWGIPNEIGQAIFEGKEPSIPISMDGLWGVYRFKHGFSQNIVSYINAHDYVYSPYLYALFTNKFFNTDRLDRIAVWMDRLKHS